MPARAPSSFLRSRLGGVCDPGRQTRSKEGGKRKEKKEREKGKRGGAEARRRRLAAQGRARLAAPTSIRPNQRVSLCTRKAEEDKKKKKGEKREKAGSSPPFYFLILFISFTSSFIKNPAVKREEKEGKGGKTA